MLLAGPGYSTDIVANYLASRVSDLVVVMEDPQSRLEMARRRARRVGWITVVGPGPFRRPSAAGAPASGRAVDGPRSSTCPLVDTTHRAPSHRVPSVNDDETVAAAHTLFGRTSWWCTELGSFPQRVLESAGCPVVNMHAGITLRYRGVHGGYWALAEQHPDWVGTTVHLVDPGIDTGGILAQTTFDVSE